MAKSGYFFRVSPLDPHATELKKNIETWIKQNIFSRVVRDAIRLYADLSNGKTDVLEELFPFVRTHYCGDTNENRIQKIVDEAVTRAIQQQQGRAIPDSRDSGGMLMISPTKPYTAPPVIAPKAAPIADAGAIADNFLMFIQ